VRNKQADQCKVYGHSAVICANTAEPIDLAFLLWTRVGEGCTSSIVFARWRQCALMGAHVAVTCRITLTHPSTAAMCLMSNYFDHTLSLAQIASASSRAFDTTQPSSFILSFMAALYNRAGHIYFHPVVCTSFFFLFFLSSPNLSRRRLDVYHTCTHGVVLVRI